MNIKNLHTIHFTGIKGVGMTALALCAQDLGIQVTGSDIAEVFVTDETLKRRGISWKIGFNKENLKPKPELLITTGAHGGLNNPEVVAAREMGIPVMTHAEALAEFASGKETIAVCGVGGKSTTSAMIANIFAAAGLHPSFAIGVGDIHSLGAPGKYDKEGKVFVAEADEFAISPGVDNRPRFSLLSPKVIVATNIEHDHPDIYPTIEDTKKAFSEFFAKVPPDGLLIANENNQNIMEIIKNLSIPVKNYTLSDFKLKVLGDFNQLNASAAAEVARFYDISEEKIKKGLVKFTGTRRRFEKMGKFRGADFYDDYAHTPHEIKSVLSAVKQNFPEKRLVAIFQPHTYSRTKTLLSEFSRSFSDADMVAIMDIYASARETDDLGMSGELLTEEIKKNHTNTFYTGDKKAILSWIKTNVKPGDIVLTLGAGDIFQIYHLIK
ncbi:UDP-N-acetylmuramate--L-alanine ligase [Candidatus Microgenomates bacterium]|nr:UDP-N-acetylmuramate--L-alanine ligase [Candidatus Microgenomates bacterium]